MLLNCIIGDDFEGSLVDNISIVAPSCYSCVCNAVVSVRKEILRPETRILLSCISRPCIFAVASQAVNKDDTSVLLD